MFGRTTKRTATPGEAAVVSAILYSSGDPRAERLLAQFTQPKRALRTVHGSRLVVGLDVVTSDLRVELDEDLLSKPVVVRDETTQVPLTFTLQLAAGGFVQQLVGEAEGIEWPDLWSVEASELAEAAIGSLQIPPLQPVPVTDVLDAVGCERALAAEAVTTRLPVTREELDDLEAAQGASLPEGAAELLLVSNGLVVPPTTVLGVGDLYLAEVPGLGHRWSLGFAGTATVFISGDEGVLASQTPEEPASWTLVAAGYVEWVRDLLSGG